MRSHSAFEGGMDLGQQAADAVAGLGDLAGQILVDNTPRIMVDWGQQSCRAWLADPSIPGARRR